MFFMYGIFGCKKHCVTNWIKQQRKDEQQKKSKLNIKRITHLFIIEKSRKQQGKDR